MVGFVKRLCLSALENESQKRSAVHLLRALNLEDMETIMNDKVSVMFLIFYFNLISFYKLFGVPSV